MLEFIKQIAKEKAFAETERFSTVWPPWGATGQPIWTRDPEGKKAGRKEGRNQTSINSLLLLGSEACHVRLLCPGPSSPTHLV